jgi:putative polyketide hydroxylase
VLSEEGFENFVSVNGDDLWLMHHFLQPGETVDDYDKERFAEMIRQASGLPDEPVEVLSLSPWVMSPKVAATMRQGRVLLTGDAAARLSPSGGLGLNTGLQSVQNLAWKLAAVMKGEAGDALLDTYQSERHGVAFATMQNTNSNAEEIFAIITAGMEGQWDKVRELISQSRRAGSGLGQDLGIRYSEGAFVPDGTDAPAIADPINDYRPSARPGGRAPHLWADESGRSILRFFGGGFCLLAGKEGHAWRAGTDVSIAQNGREFCAEDFERVYGITPGGAVLVRPDGYVGARFFDAPKDPEASLKQVLDLILRR